ncbi:pyridoxamine 5'-phosphate oxidase family protein [Streptomyces sp. NPDC006475]|uniref:pyridoxamine 5'-phosphate oxidase family protein n=1 Tax=Streptomyces sp. NPDC006475 TaxID=3155719 RepID=UPI0033A2C31E
MHLDEVKAEAARLSPWAHIATIGADNKPHVVPVHPAWEGDTLWFSTSAGSVKVRNIGANPAVAMHWQVDESGDGVLLSGTATVHTDIDTKRRLWTGVFDYDLNDFIPGGPDSPDAAFVAVAPERIVVLKQFGMGGRDTWHRT